LSPAPAQVRRTQPRYSIRAVEIARSKPKAKGKTQNQQHESTTDKGEPDESGDAAKVRQSYTSSKLPRPNESGSPDLV